MSGGSYYVPDQSRFPIFMAFSLFVLVMGASSTINNIDNPDSNSAYILYAGLGCLFATMFFWFRQVIKEHLAGLDSNQLKQSYVYGMAWFIFSEVMFFAAFFGALFYVRTLAVPWLAGEGEKGIGIAAIELWQGFESTWPVITTPDQGDGFALAEKSMAWPGWDHALEWLWENENYKPDYIIFMQCTTPLITGEDIDETYAELITNNADVSHIVTPFHGFVWKLNKDKAGVGINHDIRKRLRRQDLEKQYLETGALYVMNAEGFIRERNRFFGKITFHSIPLERSIEIDNMIDFKLAELHSNRKK